MSSANADSPDQRALGNQAFKEGLFDKAIELYTNAIDENVKNKDGLKAVLCNRAACFLKIQRYEDCKDDCSAAIELDRRYVKAYYRRAQACVALGDGNGAAKDLKFLLTLDPSNREAVALMRETAKLVQLEASENSDVNRVLKLLQDGKETDKALKTFISLCNDDASHMMEVGRRGGHLWLASFIDAQLDGAPSPDCIHRAGLAVRALLALAQHPAFITSSFTIADNVDEFPLVENEKEAGSAEAAHPLVINGKISYEGLCRLIREGGNDVSRAATSLMLKVLQAWPQGEVVEVAAPQEPVAAAPAEVPRFEEVDSDGNPVEKKAAKKRARARPDYRVVLYLKKKAVRLLIKAWLGVVRHNDCDPETYALSLDALIAFISDMNDYVTQNKVVDTRNEGMDERKTRMKQYRIVKARSASHGEAAIDCEGIEIMMTLLDDPVEVRRSRAFSVLSRLISATDKDDVLKNRCWPYVYHKWRPGVEYNEKEEEKYDPQYAPPPALCRRRAWLEACLLVTKPELGVWALERQGGMHQLMMLAATQDIQNQEAAAEVFCLAASVEGATVMLEPVVSAGVLNLLLQSAAADVRAAAASTLTKLSLKAKALATDSSETTQSLNVALSVLKNALQLQNEKPLPEDGHVELSHRLTNVSFSSLEDSCADGKGSAQDKVLTAEQKKQLKQKSVASVERAVEVLAALVGRSAVKEELVHGSARVASPMSYITSLVLDERSTASYGIAHILAALTVTNKELRDKALAEKDITPEQFEQLQELQRVKTKDADGNVIEEKKEEDDPDTLDMCKRRIQKIAECGGLKALLRLLEHASTQTKLTAATALRQMNVEPAVRGLFIQQGGLKTCHDLVVNVDEDRAVRREAGHAMAKSLVTTNPMMLSEHLRLSAVKPLIYLCKDTESTNLMQFESLLSLTNLTSVGDREKDLFVAEKGVPAAHYLMFCDHLAVRRAATETLCNVASKEGLLKLLRNAENVKLWVAFCEDWDSEESDEALATALASSGTLAVAASDEGVNGALLQCGCGESIASMIGSGVDGLIHRALVLAIELVTLGGLSASNHLGENGVVAALANMVKNKQDNPTLMELGKDLAETMSRVSELSK